MARERGWGEKLGYTPAELDQANREAIAMLLDLRRELETPRSPMVISGCLGPRGDGYDPSQVMSQTEAERYHARQVRVFAEAGADLVAAITMTNTHEAIGIAQAARAEGLPVVISFTVETDGRLPTGESLKDAIEAVDAATERTPAYDMINCAHPTHFADALGPGDWGLRIRGVRANASRRSHAELNEAPDLDAGDPVGLGAQYRDLRRRFPHLNVLGGCCGTDHRHIAQICGACRLTA